MTIIMSTLQQDRFGNHVLVADEVNALHIWVNVSTDRQASAELPGQVDVKVLKVTTRIFPVDTFDRIEFRGEEWDLAVPPVISQWTKATSHVSMILRSRNRKVVA